MTSGYRKPLIVMSPKSLLRHESAVSPLSALTDGEFQKIIPETDDLDPVKVKRLIICYGKIYYKLHEVRQQQYDLSTAIVRVEQLYPFPRVDLHKVRDQYPNLENVVWCQDEPRNQGAWREYKSRLHETFAPLRVQYAGRISSASSAAGYMALHLEQENRLVRDAFELENSFELEKP
jgi:2-oxoglutarate dehydrogenase E1 component